ncbi:uncharacterized protein LOC105178940 [Sesamum indicum]|uniref:Uncharacterized protein LOC105178940 n=1 Tax=Sesamum indicum TaxID=4182 RepID=A0A6I9UGY2_SESIN|nr:uncharacterized protein LOC105178940 [Sesamum indicum]
MRAVEECRPPTYWSYTPDKQRLELVKTTTTTAATGAKTNKPNINNKPKPKPNLVVSVRDASRATMINSSSSSYTLPNAHYGNKDAEVRRKQRIMSYNAYAVEGKLKASIRSSFRWMKNKCSTIVHGY